MATHRPAWPADRPQYAGQVEGDFAAVQYAEDVQSYLGGSVHDYTIDKC